MQARLCEDLITSKGIQRAPIQHGIYTNTIQQKKDQGGMLNELKGEWKKKWFRDFHTEEKERKKRKKMSAHEFNKNSSFSREDITPRKKNNTCLTALSPEKLEEYYTLGKENEEKSLKKIEIKNPENFKNKSPRWKKRKKMKKFFDRPKTNRRLEIEFEKPKKKKEDFKIDLTEMKTSYFTTSRKKKFSNSCSNSDVEFWLRKKERKKKKILKEKRNYYRSKFAQFCDGLASEHIKKENLELDIGVIGSMDRNPIFGFSSYNSEKIMKRKRKGRRR